MSKGANTPTEHCVKIWEFLKIFRTPFPTFYFTIICDIRTILADERRDKEFIWNLSLCNQMLYYWRISRFERHNGHKVKWEKSHFDSNVGISCREETRARIKPSRDFCSQTTFATSVTSFTCHSTACVWQGNSGMMTAGVSSWVQPVAYLWFHK